MEQLEINYSPHPYQIEVHESEHRFRLIVGGRRVGKTQLALQECIKHCLTTPNALCWWIAPTYREAKEIGWEEFLNFFDTLAPAITAMNSTNLNITFINGAKLFFKGSDNPDSLRGRGLTFLVLDEAAFIHEDAWKKALRPALSDKQGRAIFTSTPNGRNWFYDQFKYAGYEHNTGWRAWKWPSHLNPLLTPSDLEDAKNELSLNDYRQEYLADFITKAGMIYDDFTDENILKDFNIKGAEYDVFLGIDFGYANPSCCVFMAVDRLTQQVTQFDEIYINRTPIQKIGDMIEEHLHAFGLTKQDVQHIYTDPAGNAEELSSGISPVDYLRKQGYTVINKGTNVAPGLALVRSFILNAAGKRRYFVHERCKETIRSMYGYTYKLFNSQPTEEPLKDNENDHACDAVRYFFVNRFDHAKYIFSKLDQPSYVGTPEKASIMKKCGKCRGPFLSHTPKNVPPFLCRSCLNA
jgi:PBSX family phage terminase large subunit